MEKIKVVWVCSFSNPEVRSHLQFGIDYVERLRRRIMKKVPFNTIIQNDYGLWNSRGINEFKNFDDVELHVISSASFLSHSPQEFVSEGIHYYFYTDDSEFLWHKIRKIIDKEYLFVHKKANLYINQTIDRIKPDVIHLIGAENMYSTFVLSRSEEIPVIVYLQTLVCEPGFRDNYPFISDDSFKFVSNQEFNVIKRCEYIGTESDTFKNYILKAIDTKANIFNMNVATSLPIYEEETSKEFDFVYFAHGIKKACDLAIEAFIIAGQKYPHLTLDVVGQYDDDFRIQLRNRLKEFGLESNVIFEGLYPTHEDAIEQIKKSRFALLPFKVDYNPTTIPEAMSLGLPVVSTRTDGVKVLYQDGYNILLSDIGDHAALANNMIKLIELPKVAKAIRENAFNELKRDSNTVRMRNWVDIYKKVISKQ